MVTSGCVCAHIRSSLPVSRLLWADRLGPLGFMMQNLQGKGGMHGLLDAITALKWVHSNIGAFGGDASRVTVFGESAGGEATCGLAVSPAAMNLFQHAIVESGAHI